MNERQIEVGEFIIVEMDNGAFWIGHSSGEGTQVSAEKFEKLISDFYNKEF